MPVLSAPQKIFLNDLNTKYRAFVGGYGSGKTFVGCLDLLIFAGKYPKIVQGYFAPSYPAIRDIFYPTIDEAANLLGFTVKIKVSDKEVDIYRGRSWYGKIICRSMDKPGSIIGYEIANALVDEIDVLNMAKATDAWRKIIARLRLKVEGVVNGVGVTTTPEGFRFVHSMFASDPKPSYSMVQASTYENAHNLPVDYIPSLKETYPDELVDAYVDGQFVNLTSGTVYRSYDRQRHASTETVQDREPLRIGMDFNVMNMSAVVYVMRGEEWHAVDEFKGIYDTPAMIDSIKERYQNHNIRIYPDATGKNRKSNNASTSDIALLQGARFDVYANPGNPFVKDRVQATNAAFEKGRLFINYKMCPEYARCMEQQAYDANGEPDKKHNLDHLPDAGTYPIAFELPIIKPLVDLSIKFAM